MNNLFCIFCKKNYSRRYNFKVHFKKFHPKVYAESELSIPKPKIDQKCPLCDYSSKLRNDVEKHLFDFHEIHEVSSFEILHFTSNEDFVKWKRDTENSTNTIYIQSCGVQRSKNVKTTYYYCNRSGYFAPKGLGKRALRTQGSSKINSVCPAKIKKKETKDGIEVHYLDIHIGHTPDLRYINLQKEEKDEIALKMAQNVPFDTILEEIKQSVETGEKIDRLKLLKKKDLWNIKHSYTVNGMLSHMNAELSKLKDDNEEHLFDQSNTNVDEMLYYEALHEIKLDKNLIAEYKVIGISDDIN